jgi:hypothetical protein
MTVRATVALVSARQYVAELPNWYIA